MCRAVLGEEPRTVIEVLAKLKCGDVALSVRSPLGRADRQIA
jgi:hypothetical protein